MGVRECCVQTAFILFTLANISESVQDFRLSLWCSWVLHSSGVMHMHQELVTLRYWSEDVQWPGRQGFCSSRLHGMSLGNQFPTFSRNCIPSKHQQSITHRHSIMAQENKILDHSTVKISEFMPDWSCYIYIYIYNFFFLLEMYVGD